MEIGILIGFLGCLAILNYRIAKSVLYPPFLFSMMWLLVFLFYQANLIEVDPLHGETLLLIGWGAFLFSVGGSVAELIPRRLINIRIEIGDSLRKPRQDHLVKYLLLAGFFLGMLLIVHDTITAGMQGAGGNILANARSAGVQAAQNESSRSISVLTYVPVWSCCAAILFLVEKRNRLFWCMAFIAFVAALFTTGRGPILLLFASLITVHLVKERKLTFSAALRFVRIPIFIFLALYTVLIFTNKDLSAFSGGVLGIILYFVVGYIVGPVAALDYVLQHASDYAHEPNHTFKFPLQIASALHLLQYTPPPFLDQFVTVPFPTNVYTGYKFFFTDFGFLGCLAIVGVIGFLQTLLYRKAISGSALGLYCFAFTIFPLVMFIFDDLYSALGEMLNMLLFGCLYMLVRPLRLLPALTSNSTRVAAKAE